MIHNTYKNICSIAIYNIQYTVNKMQYKFDIII